MRVCSPLVVWTSCCLLTLLTASSPFPLLPSYATCDQFDHHLFKKYRIRVNCTQLTFDHLNLDALYHSAGPLPEKMVAELYGKTFHYSWICRIRDHWDRIVHFLALPFEMQRLVIPGLIRAATNIYPTTATALFIRLLPTAEFDEYCIELMQHLSGSLKLWENSFWCLMKRSLYATSAHMPELIKKIIRASHQSPPLGFPSLEAFEKILNGQDEGISSNTYLLAYQLVTSSGDKLEAIREAMEEMPMTSADLATLYIVKFRRPLSAKMVSEVTENDKEVASLSDLVRRSEASEFLVRQRSYSIPLIWLHCFKKSPKIFKRAFRSFLRNKRHEYGLECILPLFQALAPKHIPEFQAKLLRLLTATRSNIDWSPLGMLLMFEDLRKDTNLTALRNELLRMLVVHNGLEYMKYWAPPWAKLIVERIEKDFHVSIMDAKRHPRPKSTYNQYAIQRKGSERRVL